MDHLDDRSSTPASKFDVSHNLELRVAEQVDRQFSPESHTIIAAESLHVASCASVSF